MTTLLPATPAAEKLALFLPLFNTGDRVTYRTIIADHFTDEQIDTAVAWYEMLFRQTGGLDLVRVGRSDEHRITVLVKARQFDVWADLTLAVKPEAPHRVAWISPEFRTRPADLSPGGRLSDEKVAAKLEHHVNQLVAADLFSGSVLVVREGRVLFQQAYGLASQAYGAPNRLDTRFNLGSMNKMFTGIAITQLVQAGRVALTDTVGKYLPDYPQPAAEQVTIRHLLTHTAGLGSYWNQRFQETKARLRTVSDFIPLFRDQPLAFEPGARFQYSNAGFILLGAIIEQVTGQSYFDYVREHIYTPAGMTDTACYSLDEDVPNLAVGYTYRDGLGTFRGDRRFNNLFLHVVKGGPAGGGYSTAPDLLRFATALREHKLLDAAHTELALTGQADVAPGRRYGFGFFDERSNGARVVGHSGGFSGINSSLDMLPDLDCTVIVMSNYDPPAAGWVSAKAIELLTQG